VSSGLRSSGGFFFCLFTRVAADRWWFVLTAASAEKVQIPSAPPTNPLRRS